MAERANTPNWKKIKAEYIRGGISQQKLADKYGVHRSTLQARMQREGWQQLRSDVVAKTGQKLVKKKVLHGKLRDEKKADGKAR